MRASLPLVALASVLALPSSAPAGEPVWTEGDGHGELAEDDILRFDSFAKLAKQVSPAVVNIVAFESTRSLFGGKGQRAGSGFLINADGYVMTNAHVVEDCDVIVVTTADGVDWDASIVGLDPPTDLALIKIAGSGLPLVPLGDSDRIEVGE